VRPLSLTIEGFTAFRDRQEIDFRPLELFVITGPTGAGKTSILDAIAFALYGEVPRIGSRRGTADVISLGTDRAAVEFEFTVGDHGRHRVARRISHRQGQSVTLERQEGEDWVPVSTGGVIDTNERIQELIGLDFDGFTRAVILPQGEFHRFLKGDTSERRKVLFSLLGVSYFQRMGQLARAKQADLEAGVKTIADLLEGDYYVDATEAHLRELRTAADDAAGHRAKLAAAHATATAQAKLAAEVDSRVRSLEAAAGELAAVTAGVRGSLDSIRSAEQGREAQATALAEVSTELDTARGDCERAQTELDALYAEHGTLEALATATAAAEARRDTAEEERLALAQLDDATAADASAREALAQVLAAESEVAGRLTDASARGSAAATRAEQARTAAEALERTLETARQRAAELCTADETLAEIDARLPGRREQASARLGDLAHAGEALEQHRRQHAVAELAEGLEPGEACPVCGVALTTAVAVEPHATEALAAARAAEQAASTAHRTADAALTEAETKRTVAVARRDECRVHLTTALEGHEGLPELEAAAARASTDRTVATDERDEFSRALAAVGAERESAREAVTAARLHASERESAVEAVRRALTGIRERCDAAESALRDRFGGTVPDDALDRLADDRARVAAASDSLAALRTVRDAVGQRHDAAANALADADRSLAAIDLELTGFATTCGAVAARLAADGTGTGLGQAPSLDGGRARSAEAITTWSETSLEALAGAAGVATTDRDLATEAALAACREQGADAADAETALALLGEVEQAAIVTSTEARAAVEECERKLEAKADMEAKVKDDRARITVLASLGQELQNNRFGDYIIDETLSLLSAHASGELKRISGGRYSLRPAKGEFQVVDHANADEARSVRTLSGGETFLASLALALALSRHVGVLAADGMGARLESVFIDEGFGTLDQATLDEVIDALERLRAEELMVGVISHVPELAQRIQSGLTVEDLGGRSRIVPTVVE
jgi:DNA repair protein SbcC/Rad50